ncbi:uncharacterized protein LOC135489214 [Lineus longissimus]|uniref:uncharacterized protein LOC135489214 n=1 Tax=Lineus longissimus TaxID=88925 RepID=UPI002B4F85B8
MYKLVFLLAVVGCGQAFFFGGPAWDGLAVTWGPNPFNGNYFDQMPRTEKDAKKKGWTKISGCDEVLSESSGDGSPVFLGNRYVKGNDPAVMLLYDKNGYIAGIQQGIPKSENYPTADETYGKVFQFDPEKNLMVQTAYFVPPQTICSEGRTSEQYDKDGTGSNLYLQEGPDPVADSTMIPREEKDIGAKWTKGKCFFTMGQHYWYDTSLEMSCDDFYPAFLLYNKGKLNGFGWALNHELKSFRYERPPNNELDKFFQVVPKCLYNTGARSTMHIYMDNHPMVNFC